MVKRMDLFDVTNTVTMSDITVFLVLILNSDTTENPHPNSTDAQLFNITNNNGELKRVCDQSQPM